jgi:hypothetical protein
MLLNYIRLFTNISSTLSDKSLPNQDDTQTVSLVLGTSDYVYIAQRYPFTSIFMHMDTVNSNASVISAQYWDGIAWRDAVDLMDGTSTSGVTLAKSGMIQFSLDDEYTWNKVFDTEDSVSPTELQTLKVYNCYWARLKVSASLSAGTDSKEVGYCFTTSQRLKDFDVEIDSYLASFSATKTDWIDEIKTGSKLLVQDLKRMGLIVSSGQVIELDDVYVPATLRSLMLIYSHLGPSYKDKIEALQKEYSSALNIKRFTFDSNADGKLEQREISGTIKRMIR